MSTSLLPRHLDSPPNPLDEELIDQVLAMSPEELRSKRDELSERSDALDKHVRPSMERAWALHGWEIARQRAIAAVTPSGETAAEIEQLTKFLNDRYPTLDAYRMRLRQSKTQKDEAKASHRYSDVPATTKLLLQQGYLKARRRYKKAIALGRFTRKEKANREQLSTDVRAAERQLKGIHDRLIDPALRKPPVQLEAFELRWEQRSDFHKNAFLEERRLHLVRTQLVALGESTRSHKVSAPELPRVATRIHEPVTSRTVEEIEVELENVRSAVKAFELDRTAGKANRLGGLQRTHEKFRFAAAIARRGYIRRHWEYLSLVRAGAGPKNIAYTIATNRRRQLDDELAKAKAEITARGEYPPLTAEAEPVVVEPVVVEPVVVEPVVVEPVVVEPVVVEPVVVEPVVVEPEIANASLSFEAAIGERPADGGPAQEAWDAWTETTKACRLIFSVWEPDGVPDRFASREAGGAFTVLRIAADLYRELRDSGDGFAVMLGLLPDAGELREAVAEFNALTLPADAEPDQRFQRPHRAPTNALSPEDAYFAQLVAEHKTQPRYKTVIDADGNSMRELVSAPHMPKPTVDAIGERPNEVGRHQQDWDLVAAKACRYVLENDLRAPLRFLPDPDENTDADAWLEVAESLSDYQRKYGFSKRAREISPNTASLPTNVVDLASERARRTEAGQGLELGLATPLETFTSTD